MALCWSCNPLCGKCAPPSMVSVACPDCGKISVFDYQLTSDPQSRSCVKCGYDFTWDTVPAPKFCQRYGLVCGNPCGQASQPASEDSNTGKCTSWSAAYKAE